MGANLEKSLFAPRAYAVPLCPKGEIVFVCSLRPLWSCYALRALVSLRLLLNLKSLHHVTQPYAGSIVPERLCSLCMNKSGKVFAYSFALAVFIVTKYLCSLHTLRQP